MYLFSEGNHHLSRKKVIGHKSLVPQVTFTRALLLEAPYAVQHRGGACGRFTFQATTEDNNFSSLKIYLFSMQQQIKCLSGQRHFIAESGQYPFLHSAPKFFHFIHLTYSQSTQTRLRLAETSNFTRSSSHV